MKMLLALLNIFIIFNSYSFQIKGTALKDAPLVFEQIKEEFKSCKDVIEINYMPLNLYPQSVLAQSHMHGGVNLIELNSNFTMMTDKKKYFLILHEIGHIKGLRHSQREEDIMYESQKSNHDFKNYKIKCFKRVK